jgi:hypothetical protein
VGSWYSAISAMVYSQEAWKYDSYTGETYYDYFVLVPIGAGSTVFISFGAMNLAQIDKISTLFENESGERVPKIKHIGVTLYATSIATTTLNILSTLSGNKTFVATTSLVNASVLISSYFVNSIAYSIIRKKIVKSASEKEKSCIESQSQNRIKVLPYAYTSNKDSGAGMILRF